jgi:hypothetical protein
MTGQLDGQWTTVPTCKPGGFSACVAWAQRSEWEPHPRGDGWWSARLYRGEGAAPTKKHDAMSGSNRIMTTPKGYKYFA